MGKIEPGFPDQKILPQETPYIELLGSLRENDPLLEIRDNDAVEVAHIIEKNQLSLIAHEARSGSTSVMKSVAARLKAVGYQVLNTESSSTRSIVSALEKFPHADATDDPKKLAIIIGEAGVFPTNTNSAYEQGGDILEREKSLRGLFKEAGTHPDIHIAFLVHQGGAQNLAAWLEVVMGEGHTPAQMQLESFDREDLEKMFDILNSTGRIHPELNSHKQEVVQEAHSPQQLASIVEIYTKSRAMGKNHEEAWELSLNLSETLQRAIRSSLLTSGGAPLVRLLKRIRGNSLTRTDLNEKEQEVLAETQKFHFIRARADGTLEVQGEILGRYIDSQSEDNIDYLKEIEQKENEMNNSLLELMKSGEVDKGKVEESLFDKAYGEIFATRPSLPIRERGRKFLEGLSDKLGQEGLELVLKTDQHSSIGGYQFERLNRTEQEMVRQNPDLFTIDSDYDHRVNINFAWF